MDVLVERAERSEAVILACSAVIGDEAKDGEMLHATLDRIVKERDGLRRAAVGAKEQILEMYRHLEQANLQRDALVEALESIISASFDECSDATVKKMLAIKTAALALAKATP